MYISSSHFPSKQINPRHVLVFFLSSISKIFLLNARVNRFQQFMVDFALLFHNNNNNNIKSKERDRSNSR